MLKSMRRSVQSTFVKVFLFGLLIISFGLWGVTDIFYSSPESQTVARVDDAELDFPTYANQFQATLRQTGLLGAGIEINANTGQFIESAVLDSWSLGVALSKEIAALGLAVTDAELRDEISRDPSFRDENGSFSRNRFESFLTRHRMSEQIYLDQLRGAVLQNQLVRSLLSSTPVPPMQAKLLAQYDLTYRSSRSLEVLATPLMAIASATEADISTYYNENQERFRVPEKRQVDILSLSIADIAADVTLADGALEEYFAENQAQYSVPERRTVERILFADEDKARAGWLAIQDGQDFMTVAEKMAGLDAEAVNLGEITRENFADAVLAEEAFDLTLNAVSDPFEGLFGWMVVRVQNIEAAIIPELSSVRDTLEAELRQEQAANLVFDYADQVEDLLASGATLAEIAADIRLPQSGMQVVMDESDTVVDSLLRTQIAVLTETESRQMFEDDAGGYRLVELQRIMESAIPALADIRDTVQSAWRESQQRALALSQATTLAERINRGETLEQVAAATDLVVRESVAVNRAGQTEEAVEDDNALLFVPESTHIGALFALDSGVAVALPSSLGARIMVLQQETVADNYLEFGQAALKSEVASDLYFGFEEALRAKYPIERNRVALDYMYDFLNGTGQRHNPAGQNPMGYGG